MNFDTTAANAILEECGPEATLAVLREKVMELRLSRPSDPLLEMLTLFLAELEDSPARSGLRQDRSA
jgi:hypothetical protein